MKIIRFNILSLILFIGFFDSSTAQWIYQQVPTNATHYVTLEFPSAQNGMAGGGFISQNFSGRGVYTTNSGMNWNISQVPDSSRILIDIKLVNLTTGYCAGAYNSTTSNHPFELNKYDAHTFQLLHMYPQDIGGSYRGLFMKTTNSGQSWFTYGTLPSNVYYLLGLHFVNSTTGFAIASYNYSGGVNTGVIKTTNAGLNWTVLTMPENINDLSDIYFSDLNTGYTVGSDVVNDTGRGAILKTTNAGVTWNRLIFMEIYELTSIHFTNSLTGLAVGRTYGLLKPGATEIYKTTNAGINWMIISNFNEIEVQGIRFVVGTGIALLYGIKFTMNYIDFFAKTTNFGSTWIEGTLNDTGLILIDAELLDQNNWYLSGGDFSGSLNRPVILHTTNGGAIGIQPISNEIPNQFSLSQNYPNPFNPTTKIKFALTNNSFAKIIIYDMLGREIETIVNEQLNAGTYEADWNAKKLSSGVYYYKLVAGDFVDTKKMVLIK